MPDYRIYALGPDGRIKGARPFVCEDDHAVLAEAEKIGAAESVEIWEGNRLIGRVDHTAAAAGSREKLIGKHIFNITIQTRQARDGET